MKNFLKWLGVSEKVSKIAVWLLIIMVSLVIINVFLESIGLPYYKITVDNLTKLNYGKAGELIFQFILSVLNFYSIIFIVIRVKDFKKTIKYALLYIILNTIVVNTFDYAILQIFIFAYVIVYCFFYGNKQWKYVMYGIGSIILNF